MIFHPFLYVYQRVYRNTFQNWQFFNEEHEVVIHWVLGHPIFRQTNEFLGGNYCVFLDGKSWILGWTFHGLFFFHETSSFLGLLGSKSGVFGMDGNPCFFDGKPENGDFPWDFMGFYGDFNGINGTYPAW